VPPLSPINGYANPQKTLLLTLNFIFCAPTDCSHIKPKSVD
jgi:hypothetical protein